MSTNPFRAPGEWLKAALHTHSTESDGTLPPARLVTTYEEAGFDVVAITDHWRLTEVPSTDRVLTVRGAELGWDLARPNYPTQSAEFLVYGVDHLPDDPGGDRANWYTNPEEHYEVRTFADLTAGCAWAATMGAVVYVAHPYWNGLHVDDIASQDGYVGIEVYNASAEDETGRGDSSPWWDALLRTGRPVMGIATDDQHYPLFELGAAWTMVRAAERTEAAVLDALRTGATYLSEGPVIHDVEVTAAGVEVACSPARQVRLHTEEEWGTSVSVGRHGRRNGRILETDGHGLITRVLLDRQGERLYERVTVVDEHGRRAWTNPLQG